MLKFYIKAGQQHIHILITLVCKVSEIVAVIDMDGYQIQNKFLCKEMGLLKVGDTEAKSFFDINLRWGDLTHKDRKTCSYVQNRIHKLPLGVPRGIKAFQISELEAIVENFYIEIRKNPDSTIAYKGGHYEKDLLAKLNIPSVNLEYFGCPTAGELLDQLIWLETCGNHIEDNAYQHCAKVEVEAYALWMRQS